MKNETKANKFLKWRNSKFYKEEKGITLVALIISIIILIILATVAIKAIVDIDFVGLATNSTVKYAGQQIKEEKMFNDIYSKILVADNDNAEITISVKDLNSLIEEKVNNAVSVLQQETQNKLSSQESKITALEETNKKLMENSIRFVDYSKILKTSASATSFSWTATEDCILIGYVKLINSNSCIMYADGKFLAGGADSDATSSKNIYEGIYCYAKKGTKITTNNGLWTISAYALKE